MPKTYKISVKDAAEIKEIRKTISDKVVDRRLYAVQLRGEGKPNRQIAEKLNTSDKMVSQWVSAYAQNGITALLPKKRIGNYRNFSFEEENELLSEFIKQAEAGQIVTELSVTFPEDFIILACDGAAWHKSKGLEIPKNIEIIFIPPYTTEMNPIEQTWKEIRKRGFKNEAFSSLQNVIDRLSHTISPLFNHVIKNITARDWILSCF